MLVNPHAGRGAGAKVAPKALAVLQALGADIEMHELHTAKSMRELAEKAVLQRPDAIVVVGGDGTLSAVVDALANSGVPLAAVPAGTGNDFVRAMGIRHQNIEVSAEEAALAINGAPTKIDLARITADNKTRCYLTVAAMGFDALVSERTNRLKWPRGAMRYYLALVIELIKLKPLQFKIVVDGSETAAKPGILAAVGNTSSYGGGMPMCPEADASDGWLDITHVAPLTRIKLIRLFPLLLKGKHTNRAEVTTLRGKKVKISAPGLIVYADGERVGTQSVEIEVLKGALTVLAP